MLSGNGSTGVLPSLHYGTGTWACSGRVAWPPSDDAQLLSSLVTIARDRADYDDLWELAEDLLTHDELAGVWRARHVAMVERQIGTKSGTGGSTGAPYLRSRLSCTITRCFGSFVTGCSEQADAVEQRAHAVEPILVNSGEQKESLLVSAAERLASLLGDDFPDVGDPLDYLRAYYRHFPPDDLTAIGPDRAAAVAAEHARLGARRPQGSPWSASGSRPSPTPTITRRSTPTARWWTSSPTTCRSWWTR